MAANEMINYLENGNIRNSVNFPNVELQREGTYRLCVINRNIPNMVGQVSAFLANRGVNIENMLKLYNKYFFLT